MPGTSRDSGPSPLETSWGPVRLLVSVSPNYERATSDNVTNSLSSLSHRRISLSRMYYSAQE
ncbi:hypothetical protein Taro_041322 [Colocasia esculenta]|uniref:Uncharacterized protein n=1 Tax=Colocasia esculenta TaxID=4460 RepID=A0A843WVI5_COLES|nr:hypothetical protein [Colocasia esculenta]